MESALLAVALVVALGLVVATLIWGRGERSRNHEVWRSFAEHRGYRFIEAGSSWLRQEPAAVEAVREQALVFLDTYIVSSGKSSATHTRARARLAIGGGPRFEVYEEGVFSSIGKALGGQDVTLGGDRTFDDWFIVRCGDVEATRLAWTESAKRRMRTRMANGRAKSDGREVEVVVLGFVDDPSALEALIEQAAELASFGVDALVELADELPRAELVSVQGDWRNPRPPHVLVETDTGPVQLTRSFGPAGFGLTASTAARRELPRFTLAVERGQPVDDPPRGLLDERGAELLRKLENASIRHDDGTLRLRLEPWPEPKDIAPALALLSQLAGTTPSVGAFR